MPIITLFLIIFTFQMVPAHAQEKQVFGIGEGIAMHGDAKYAPSATHLDYANPSAPQGGTLKQAVIGTFDSLNPFALKGKAAQGLHLTYDRLMQRVWDEPFTLYPLIAERAELADDRSGITFYLNPAARFNDGTPITADDVLFSFETLKNEGRPNMRRIYELASTAKKIDQTTVSFTFKEGYDQETAMIFAMMPVLSKKYWENKTFDSSTLNIPVTSGPYKITNVDPGKSLTLQRDKNYWANNRALANGQYNFDRLVYEYMRDDTVALEAFRKGNFDIRMEYNLPKWETAYKGQGGFKKVAFRHARPVRTEMFIFNTRRAPFDDIRVRKALNLAFDAEWVNKNIFYGRMKRIGSFFDNSELEAPKTDDLWQPPSNADRKEMRENLRVAGQLLQEAGWNVNSAGQRVNEEGNVFSFEILSGSPENEKVALHFVRNLQRLGIKASVRTLDSAAFRDRLNVYDYDMVSYYWQNSLSPGTEQYIYWSCEAAEQQGRWNYMGICDSEIDSLARAVPEAKDRTGLVNNVQAMDAALLNHVVGVPLFYLDSDLIAVRNNIAYPNKTPIYGPVIETWWSKRTQ